MGNRTIMMHEGRVILHIHGEDRRGCGTLDLIKLVHEASGEKLQNNRLLQA